MIGSVRIRLRIVSGLVLLLGALFIGRLYYLQILHTKEWVSEGERQYVAEVPNSFERGTIYFREKDGKLTAGATIASGYVIAIVPGLIEDKERTFNTLAEFLPIEKGEFMEKAEKSNDPYEEIAKHVSEETANNIKNAKLPGVQLFRDNWRHYPGGSFAAHILGFVGFSGDELTGRYGLESYYNDTLARGEKNLYVNFFAELFTNLSDTIFDRSVEEEGDLVLTVEPTVQSYLEREIKGVMNEWHSGETGGIVMDPSTGAILAMAVSPDFDLNQFSKVADQSIFANPIIQDVHEMGSIIKPITMAAGLDAGVVTAKSTYNDLGSLTLNNKTFSNFDGIGRGPGTTMQEVLNDSLNTGAAFVVSRLGNKRFAEYLEKKFRLGEETGIDLPGEQQGLMSNLTSRRDIEYATASFGQGIAVTPINMCAALAILGNGGMSLSPHIVEEVRYESGRVKKFAPNPPEQVIKKETSEEITRMLVEVVDHALLKGSVKIPEYSVAAKTGTAQIARPRAEGGGYYEDRYLHTFFGYFPAYEPKFIVFLYTYDPKDATFASHTLTHPFMRLTKFLLHYYNIPPDREPKLNSAGKAKGAAQALL